MQLRYITIKFMLLVYAILICTIGCYYWHVQVIRLPMKMEIKQQILGQTQSQAQSQVQKQSDIAVCMISATRPNGLLYPRAVYDSLDKAAFADGRMRLFIVHVDHPQQKNATVTEEGKNDVFLVTLGLKKDLGCPPAIVDSVDETPPCKVQQESLDFAAAMRLCGLQATKWVLILQDDMVACDGALAIIQNTLKTLDTELARFAKEPGVIAIDVRHIPFLENKIREKYRQKPIDRLLFDTPMYMHPNALFRHIGRVSTFEYRNDAAFHAMYDDLRMNSVCFQPSQPQ